MSLTSCEGALDDILGEWSRPTPGSSTGGAVAVTGIDLDADEMTLAVGEKGQLNITDVAPADATDKTVSWSSNQEAIATVDASGLVTAVAAGTAIITATANDGSGVKATCTVTVKIPGLLAGVFSISATQKVQFSQGNLQFQASTKTWRFAEHQYDYVGDDTHGNVYVESTKSNNALFSETYAGWIDMFSWGTAGHKFDSGYGDYYQPWSGSTSGEDYGPTGTSNGLYDDYVQGDWGTNAISNGGNAANSGWRTLTGGDSGEWNYLFNSRSASTVNGTENARFAKAKLFDTTYGVILFPDSYTHPDGVDAPKGINKTDDTSWDDNKYSAEDWSKMESAGCVFLPAAGYRYGSIVYNAGTKDCYWSSSPDDSDVNCAYSVDFDSSNLQLAYNQSRYYGISVRLVHPAE